LQHAPGFIIRAERRDEHGPRFKDPDLLASDRRARLA
jgi:hypothetical protein